MLLPLRKRVGATLFGAAVARSLIACSKSEATLRGELTRLLGTELPPPRGAWHATMQPIDSGGELPKYRRFVTPEREDGSALWQVKRFKRGKLTFQRFRNSDETVCVRERRTGRIRYRSSGSGMVAEPETECAKEVTRRAIQRPRPWRSIRGSKRASRLALSWKWSEPVTIWSSRCSLLPTKKAKSSRTTWVWS